MLQYNNVRIYGNKILFRGIDSDGNRIHQEIFDYHPTLFVPSNKETDWKAIDGRYVEPIHPGLIKDCRDFFKTYDGVNGFEIHGMENYGFQFITEKFPGELNWDQSKINQITIDIEVACENGFPDPATADQKVLLITMSKNGVFFVLGTGHYVPTDDNVFYEEFPDEISLLRGFLDKWAELDPDIVTGWNVNMFDIPYMYNRICQKLGETYAKALSPWNTVFSRDVTTMGRTQTVYELLGISILDYMDLYKKFTYSNQESYRLDHIANIEIGERKLTTDENEHLHTEYKRNWSNFCEYNIHDVRLVDKLEEKLGFMQLVLTMAYDAKVNYTDVFSQVRTWDAIIYNHLHEQSIVIPPKPKVKKTRQYAGAYVKDPIIGRHEWVVSYDVASLYPNLIRSYNLGCETATGICDESVTVDSMLKGYKPSIPSGHCVAANGYRYRADKESFLSFLLGKMFNDRKLYKKKMIEAQKELANLPKDHPGRKELEVAVSRNNNIQMAKKISMNSAYGSIGNEYARYFSVPLAESITLSGQLVIRWIENRINAYLNSVLKTENVDYVIAVDTDSNYINFGPLVKAFFHDKPKSEVVELLDRICKDQIDAQLEKWFDNLADLMHMPQRVLKMSRECIADVGIWTAKKRYMLNVYDSEGVRYSEPKLKIMGLETARSSTPSIVRAKLKDAIKIILRGTEDELIQFIDKFREEFNQLPPEEIAFPRGMRGLKEYADKATIFSKGTPIHVKGSLLYNYHIKQLGLEREVELIKEGEKIKFMYLNVPNPIHQPVISFPNTLPKQLNLHDFVDYGTQFEKTFLDPLKSILNSIGWETEKQSTLESFFG